MHTRPIAKGLRKISDPDGAGLDGIEQVWDGMGFGSIQTEMEMEKGDFNMQFNNL